MFGSAKSPGAPHTSSKTLFHDALPSNIPFKEGYSEEAVNRWRLVVRSVFDVHVSERERRLFYVQNNCVAGSYPGPRIILHVFPLDEADLPPPPPLA